MSNVPPPPLPTGLPTDTPPVLINPSIGAKSSEFAAVMGMLIKNMVLVLALMHVIPAGDANFLTELLLGLLGLMAAQVPFAVVLFKYIHARTHLKTEAMEHQAQALIYQPLPAQSFKPGETIVVPLTEKTDGPFIG